VQAVRQEIADRRVTRTRKACAVLAETVLFFTKSRISRTARRHRTSAGGDA
jgi:hypothetical protein